MKPVGGCILWMGCTTADGYGKRSHKGRTVRAHRLAYCKANNVPLEDIDGLVIMHACNVRNCINPRHLFLGTHKENMQHMTINGRHGSTKKEATNYATE